MSRIVSTVLLLGLAAALGGCFSRINRDQGAPALVVRRLQLEQRDETGQPLWDLRSPEARYDIAGRRAEASNLSGTLYVGGQPRYRISANRGLVIDDGAEIRLDSEARITTIEGEPIEVSARRMRWWPRRQLVELEGAPRGQQGQDRLTSRQARFLLDQQKLELKGTPTLEHWNRAADLHQRPPRPAELRLELPQQLDWFLASGDLLAAGPIRGQRLQPKGQPQTFEAADLRGNSRQRQLRLGGPVRFHSPSEAGELRGGELQADLRRRNLTSSRPFAGRMQELELTGSSLAVDLDAATLTINSGCRLTQPQQQLTAQTCVWNWREKLFSASGNVRLTRSQNHQITRSERLNGRLGKDGWLTFSDPRGRVHSQIQLEGPRQPAQQRRPSLAL